MRRFVIAAIVVGLAAVASAQSIEEKRERELAEKRVAGGVKMMNKKCKTTIPETGVIDWASWKSAVGDKGKNMFWQCEAVPSGMYSLCSDDKIGQETIAKDIKKVVCMGDSTEDVKFELKGDALIVHMNFDVKDMSKKTKKWLSKNLP